MGKDKGEKAYELAFKYEVEYGGCAQTTLAAIFDVLKVDAEDAFKSATGLGGGIGVLGDGTCGAVVGGVMAIGYFFGRDKRNFADPERKRFEVYRLAREFYLAFKEKLGTARCHDIQRKLMGRTFDLLDPKDWEEFLKLGGHTDKCPSVTGTAAKLAVELILQNLER
ncbi:hypothetical protein DRP07_01770 [Archaeoglobales archaeon]|nr:MAG: hypothetical protein DRP07_01770 [Archaeoglobales archaeon]